MNKVIRWKQRFENYQKAFLSLKEAVELPKLSNLERAGLIQNFEFCFELAWKTLKDFLESEGITAASPRESIKKAFQSSYIANGETWIEALDNRNLLSHTYNEDLSIRSCTWIREKYYPLLKSLNEDFQKKL